MEARAFDSLARRIGAKATRRAGLRGAAAALVAGITGNMAGPGNAEAKQRRIPEGGPWVAGPCGPKRSDNACTKDGDCCTKYCRKGDGAKRGHCRCVKPGQACKKGQSCCSGSICYEGLCIRNTPSKVCTVCKKNCAYSSVSEAYAAAKPGGTISIGVGTWPTGIMVTKDIRLTACDDMAGVRLIPDGSVTDTYDNPTVISSRTGDATPYTVILDGLEFVGTGKDNWAPLIFSESGTNVSFRIVDCAFSDGWAGPSLEDGNTAIVNSTFTRFKLGAVIGVYSGSSTVISSSFTACDSYGYYGAGYYDLASRGALHRLIDCELSGNPGAGLQIWGGSGIATGCSITGNSNGGISVMWGDLTLQDTTVSGNTAPVWGGGVWLRGDSYDGDGDETSLTLLGTTTITGNTAPDASGIGVVDNSTAIVKVTGASSSNVYGNLVGDQCESSPDMATWTDVPNCAF